MKCDRCQCETLLSTGSMFNTQMICMACLDIEKAHPMYKEACDAELAEVKKGNFNFRGIGLPSELRTCPKVTPQA